MTEVSHFELGDFALDCGVTLPSARIASSFSWRCRLTWLSSSDASAFASLPREGTVNF